jgi:hypothetical protein
VLYWYLRLCHEQSVQRGYIDLGVIRGRINLIIQQVIVTKQIAIEIQLELNNINKTDKIKPPYLLAHVLIPIPRNLRTFLNKKSLTPHVIRRFT